MGAVLALGVVIVGYVKVPIHVVVVVRQLGGAIQLFCRGGGRRGSAVLQGSLVGVQLNQDGANLCRIQQIVRLTADLLILCQGVVKRCRIKRLVVCIRTSVDDRNPHPRAVVSGGIGGGGPNHLAGGGHVGAGLPGGVHCRLIPGLQNDFLHPGYRFNGLHVPVPHIGGNQVGCQGQVPHHIQCFSGQSLPGNGLGHGLLALLQTGPVGCGAPVGSNARRSVAPLQGGGLLQHDGHTNGFIRVIGCLRWHLLHRFPELRRLGIGYRGEGKRNASVLRRGIGRRNQG